MENGKKCVICGESLRGRQSKYCSKICKGERTKKRRKEDKAYREEQIERCRAYKENNKEKIKEISKNYREENREIINKKQKEYREQNEEKVKKYRKEYREKNKEKIRKYHKEYAELNKKDINKYHKEYLKDPIHKLHENISSSMRQSLRSNDISKNKRKWEDLAGYTTQELREHIEKLFLPGMTWDNYGRKKGVRCWQIDHIVPKAFFIFNSTDDVEFKYCWSLDNLQPLWAFDNFSKHDKIDKKYFMKEQNDK